MFGDPVQNEKGWPLVRLDTIADIKIGPFGSLLHKEDYIEGGHALVNPSHIVDGKIVADPKLTISEDKYAELSSYALQLDDIVLGRRGEMGRCAVVYEEGLICGTGSMIIRPGSKMKSYFLQNIMSSSSFRRVIETNAVGITMKNLNVPTVSAFMFPELPIALQETYLKFVKQSDKSKFTGFKSQFIEMFGEDGEKGNCVTKTLQELIDMKWITYHLDGNHGGDYPRADEFVEAGIPYISANCIVGDRIDMTLAKYVTAERAKRFRKGIAENGDVLFAHNATVGPVAILETEEPTVILGTSLTSYRCNSNYILAEYLMAYMKNPLFIQQYERNMQQSTRKQVPITTQRKYTFIIPSMDEQKGFALFVKQSDKSK